MTKLHAGTRYTHSQHDTLDEIIKKITASAFSVVVHDFIDTQESSKAALTSFSDKVRIDLPVFIRGFAKILTATDNLHFHYYEGEFHRKKNMATWILLIQVNNQTKYQLTLTGAFGERVDSTGKPFQFECEQSFG